MRLKATSCNRFCISLVWGLALLGRHGSAAQPGRDAQAAAAASAIGSCEARTINYITHTLPQQCLRTSWSSASNDAAAAPAGPIVTSTTGEPTAAPETEGQNNDQKTDSETGGADDGQDQELATSSFMSFEEWKELQLRKAEQEADDLKARNNDDGSGQQQQQGGEGGRDEGETNLDFDALSEKVSEITASGAGSTGEATGKQLEQQKQQQDSKGEDLAIYDGLDYTRSKDAGKTCKERFSYASFDAGATVLKTGPRAKNAKAILVENKDSYMLLECAQPNKFVIIELSDDVLVDTVVIANFEFFSSMIRTFRVSVSDRYPVKLEKWKVIGTFEARNQRDIQAFLVEHPQIWAKYIRIEFLNHYGSEFYCPISLVRVHGTRMMDSWKEVEGGGDDDDEAIDQGMPTISQQPSEPQPQPAVEEPSPPEPVPADNATSAPPVVTEMGLTPWEPIFREFSSFEMCEMPEPTATDSGLAGQSSVVSGPETQPMHDGRPHDSVDGNRSTAQKPVSSLTSAIFKETAAPRGNVTMPDPAASVYNIENLVPPPLASTESPSGAKDPASASSTSTQASSSKHVSNSSKHKTLVSKPSSASAKPAMPKPSSTVPSSARNRTGTNTNSAAAASPTVQESFFKTVAKRLQLLESNTSLSMQYIEDQSRFLQDALARMERKQISRVDTFLDTLNRTVLAELRSVRSQYDQIWQSTVIALESQRDQSQREIVALSDRLSVLAEEVVFQKRMAILQSILLLACLVLIIFSRAFGGAASTVTFSGTPRHSRWAFTMPMSPPPSAGPPTGRRYGPGPPSPSPSPSRLGSIPPRSPPEDDDRLAAIDTRHRYADKTLPLTPTSEYDAGGREVTPVIHVVDETGEPSYFDDTASFSSPQRLGSEASDATPDLGYGSDTHVEPADPVVISSEPADEENVSRAEQAKYPPGGEENDGFEADAADKEVEGSGPPLTRTTLPDFGDSRKPLPALPESP